MVGLQKNGHILVERQVKPFSSELSSYDPESQQVKDLGICGVPHLFRVIDRTLFYWTSQMMQFPKGECTNRERGNAGKSMIQFKISEFTFLNSTYS